MDLCDPSSFGVDAFDPRSFHVDVRVIAGRAGGWAYEGSDVVVEVPVCIGNMAPEVVDSIHTVIGGFKKDQGDGIGETDKIVIKGLSIDGKEERLGCSEG